MGRSGTDELVPRVDLAARSWKQGDVAFGECGFLHRFEPRSPLTRAAREASEDGDDLDVADSPELGLVVVTQTCDIVRSCADRPFLEVCPIVRVKEEVCREVQAGLRPRYAHVPGTAGDHLVADLDRVMTVEKGVLLVWKRVEGCRTDAERRRLATALSRKRARFAFPNDFVRWVRPLTERIKSKHAKENSGEGRVARAIREIRVRAAPSWDDDPVALTFLFVRGDDDSTPVEKQVETWMEGLRGRSKSEAVRFRPFEHRLVGLDDLTAREYVESDPLDLDHLSDAGP